MAGVGGLDRVHREGTDCIDADRIQGLRFNGVRPVFQRHGIHDRSFLRIPHGMFRYMSVLRHQSASNAVTVDYLLPSCERLLNIRLSHLSLRYSCTNWTAIEPSPTAEATRLAEPDRTSPAAKTPGRLVSNRNGCRFRVHCRESPNSIPVRTKCFSSFSISGGNQSVRGLAPMKLKRAAVVSIFFSPVVLFKISTELK